MERVVDWIEVNGVVLRYDLQGRGANTLVLIHEMGGTIETFDGVLPQLARDRRVLRYDTRGAGLSEKIRGALSIDTMTGDVVALLDALGIEGRVALAGVAVGAAIAIRFAAQHPERAAALIALGPATGMPPERLAATLAVADKAERSGMRPGMEEGLEKTYPAELRQDLRRFQSLRGQRMGNDPASYAAVYRMLAQLDMTQDFPRVQCPTLVVAGTLDRLRPPAGAEAVARAIPGARFQTLTTGHFMAAQTPDPVADAMIKFLNEAGC
jgi:3-oxoadipate enol-lactonase